MKTIWEKLNGYKTNIGVILFLILQGINVLWPHLLKPEVSEWIRNIADFLMGIGLVHKAIKYREKLKSVKTK